MRDPPLILVADDQPDNVEILVARLSSRGYATIAAANGEQALALAREQRPDAILLDVMMPKLDGIEVCRRLKADAALPFTPVILVTAKAASGDVVAGLEAGADEYLTKPVDQAALMARLSSMLRIKALHDEVQEQAARLAEWNRTLEARVAEQVALVEHMSGLRRFLAPQVADAILARGGAGALDSHRREIVVVACDLRGFTAFAEAAEPEDVMRLLGDYHAALGALIHAHEATLERFVGDGLMVLFNDPVPCPDAPERAVRMAVAMRERVEALAASWRKSGFDLGFGVGIAQGYATLGRIGFEGRYDYASVGSVSNLGARLCDEAEAGQILLAPRLVPKVEHLAELAALGPRTLKGFHRPVPVHNVVQLKG